MSQNINLQRMQNLASQFESIGKEYVQSNHTEGFAPATASWWQRVKASVSSFFGYGSDANKRVVTRLLDAIHHEGALGEQYANMARTMLDHYTSGRFTLSGSTAARVLKEVMAQRQQDNRVITTNLGNQFVFVAENAPGRIHRQPENQAPAPQEQAAEPPAKQDAEEQARNERLTEFLSQQERKIVHTRTSAYLEKAADRLDARSPEYYEKRAEMLQAAYTSYDIATGNGRNPFGADQLPTWLKNKAENLVKVHVLKQEPEMVPLNQNLVFGYERETDEW